MKPRGSGCEKAAPGGLCRRPDRGAARVCGCAEFLCAASDRHRRAPDAQEPARTEPGDGSRSVAAGIPQSHRRPRGAPSRGAAVPHRFGVGELGRPGQRTAHRQGGLHPNPFSGQGFGDHEGRHPGIAVRYRRVRDRRGPAARSRAHRTGADPAGLADRQTAQRGVSGLAAVPGHLQTQHVVLRRPHRRDRGARSPLRGGVRPRSAGHRTHRQVDGRSATGDGQGGAQSARSAAEDARTGHPRRRWQNRGGPRIRRRPHRPGRIDHHRSGQPIAAGRSADLDAGARGYQGPLRD